MVFENVFFIAIFYPVRFFLIFHNILLASCLASWLYPGLEFNGLRV
jgi:hypothetical protein